MAINSTLALEKILDLVTQRCVHHLQAEQGAVLLLEERKTARPFQTICRVGDTSHQRLPFRLDDQLTGWMLKYRSPLLINDIGVDRRFATGEGDLFPVHSLLCVPMVNKGKMTGLLVVFDKRQAGGFSVDDQRLLAIIASEWPRSSRTPAWLKRKRRCCTCRKNCAWLTRSRTTSCPRNRASGRLRHRRQDAPGQGGRRRLF